jgi:hypothetical protein
MKPSKLMLVTVFVAALAFSFIFGAAARATGAPTIYGDGHQCAATGSSCPNPPWDIVSSTYTITCCCDFSWHGNWTTCDMVIEDRIQTDPNMANWHCYDMYSGPVNDGDSCIPQQLLSPIVCKSIDQPAPQGCGVK